jgi:hypothetical protein
LKRLISFASCGQDTYIPSVKGIISYQVCMELFSILCGTGYAYFAMKSAVYKTKHRQFEKRNIGIAFDVTQ